MPTANIAAEQASVRAFNNTHVIGTPVRYWKGVREGDGKVARTRTEAQLLGGHTAVVWLAGVSGCIALTHVEPITEGELAAAERIPAPRPVPNRSDRFADARAGCGHTPEQHRHDDGQDADDRSKDRAIRELTAERDNVRAIAKQAIAEINAARDALRDAGRSTTGTLASRITGLADDLDSTQQVATWREGRMHDLGAKLGAAEELIAAYDDATERIDRARARYATSPEVTRVEQDQPQVPTHGEARRQLDQAIATALPHAGRKVAELLQALQGELARVDSGRAGKDPNDEAEASPGSVSPRAQDLTDRLAWALGEAMRTHTGADVSVAAWSRWEALLAEHTDQPSVDGLDQVAAVAAVAAVNELRQG